MNVAQLLIELNKVENKNKQIWSESSSYDHQVHSVKEEEDRIILSEEV